MQYYENNKWERRYINAAKNTVTSIWTNFYQGDNPVMNESYDSDDLLNHVFKKHKTETDDELKIYLREETANKKTDILEWWKVWLLS